MIRAHKHEAIEMKIDGDYTFRLPIQAVWDVPGCESLEREGDEMCGEAPGS